VTPKKRPPFFVRCYRCYGYRRMRASLNKQRLNISEKVVQRLMKQERLIVDSQAPEVRSLPGEISPSPDSLLNRDFWAAAPNLKWLTDITEFQIPAGKLYLSPMIDCFDGMIVGQSVHDRMRSS
jgi:putative transposase